MVAAPLRPLTVLIGPNDSGKSVFLSAVEHLIRGTSRFKESDFWRHDITCQIEIDGDADEGRIQIKSSAHPTSAQEADDYKQVRDSLSPVQRFQLPTAGVSMECEGYSQKEENDLSIGDNGGRVAALLDYLLRRDRKRFFQIVDTLRTNIRGLEDVEIGTPSAQTRRIDLVTENGFRLKADEASVGVRLLLFFVALAHHPRPPRTILLEEPENGIHPKRLNDVMSLLRAVANGTFADRRAQVIVSTHSPYLLDFVDQSTDQVLVFERQNDGGRVAKPLDQSRLKSFLDEFMLGEIWFNEEEAGLVAKS